MYVTCDCDNRTFYIRFEPPLRGFAECTKIPIPPKHYWGA